MVNLVVDEVTPRWLNLLLVDGVAFAGRREDWGVTRQVTVLTSSPDRVVKLDGRDVAFGGVAFRYGLPSREVAGKLLVCSRVQLSLVVVKVLLIDLPLGSVVLLLLVPPLTSGGRG